MMINRKDTPAPSMRRTDPPPLNLRSTAQGNVNNSTPQTPRNKIRAKRTSKLHRATPHETYMENNARSAADDHVPDERISHDLSLTDNGWHSVVDNMLTSLNPDQLSLFSPSKDRPQFSAGSDVTSPPKSAHRHLHSSSLNSEFSFPSSDDSPNRPSNQFHRGRRSNSGTNFQSALSRINSIHVEGEAADATSAKVLPSQRPGVEGAELSSRGDRKSSKSSGVSSVDFGQMAGQSRFPHSTGRHSASFDHGDRRRVLHSASVSNTQPLLPSGLSQPVFYDDLEAAPTPTVPAGPRKDRTTAFPPQPAHAAPEVPIPQRRNSNKSSKSYMGRKKKTDNFAWDAPLPVNANTWSGRRGSKQVQPLPAFLRSRTTSPVRQYSEPLMARRAETSVSAKDAAKDRPGFFRRVFGSSRGPAPAHSDSQAPQIHSFGGGRGGTRANSREGFASSHKLSKPPLSDELYHPNAEAAQTPLVKKPSSFFRRRKKSVCEGMPPPILPCHLQSNQTAKDPAQRSPVSSLRQVMNPYLDNPVRSDARQFAGTFKYDNTPLQTHTLQAKGSADPAHLDYNTRQDAGFNDPLRQPREVPAPRRETVTERLHLKSNERTSSKPHNNSFFHDDSSNETRLPGVADDHDLSRHDTVRLDQAPSSIPTDMKSRKENARRQTRSREGTEPTSQRPLDSPRDRSVLSTLNGNVSASLHTSNATPVKSESRDWLTPAQVTKQASPPVSAMDSDRVWLRSPNSEEELRKSDITLPIEYNEVSPVSDYQSTFSTLPAPKSNGDIHFPEPTAEDVAHKLSIEMDPMQPTVADRVQAKQLYDCDETLAPQSMAAAWIGEPGPERTRIRQAYMELFEWQNLNILVALRGLCGRLYLKGEAQQVDRILDAFSTRWCACNPNHGFKASDVVHTICYSVLLLNTDLHQAEIETKMTRQQFLKNILPTVRRIVIDATPDAFTNARASTLPPARPWADSSRTNVRSSTFHEAPEPRRSFEGQRPIYRLSQRPSDQTVYASIPPQSPLDFNTSLGDTGPLVKTPFNGKLSTWENQIEIVLKDFYNSIRQEPLPLHGTETKEPAPETPQPSHSLSAMTSSMLRRTPSVLSKTGSENISYSRGRASENRLGTGRWQSKNRSRPGLYPASTVASSRRSSFDEQSSVTTPSITSAWSRFSSFGKTQTSLSIESFASNYPHGDYKQSIGFANALSQAIIREEGVGGEEEPLRAAPLLEDENLELAGAPWAKEGMLKHKYHLEAVEKKAKDRNWVDSFAVIEKGYMRLFSFHMNAKSLRQKAKNQKAPGGVVGGGNWADSAETLGTFLLRHTIASALPTPGYSKTRPHVWALSLPTGAVHLFQVGTPEIVKEFVTTANYWSARLSKEPMVGGISNIEYGWSDSVINVSLLNAERNMSSSAIASQGARPSLQSSIRSTRSSIDQGAYRSRLPGDRVVITDWTPPQQSLVASVLMEVDQLKGLMMYVKNITEELEKHNELRATMLLAFSPRHPNGTKAMSNWERKSSYLLREIVKFRTYIDCLQAAQVQKEKIYDEREKSAPAEEVKPKDENEAAKS